MSPAEYMAFMLRKQKHHIGNKCTSSPASMSIFTSNIQATQTTSALQQQPRHVEYALQPRTRTVLVRYGMLMEATKSCPTLLSATLLRQWPS